MQTTIKYICISVLISCISQFTFCDAPKPSQAQSNQTQAPQAELQALEEQVNNAQDSDAQTTQVVVGNFAHIVQNFFNIAQNSHDPIVVGSSITHMISSLVNTAMHIMKNMPAQDRDAYLATLESALKENMRSLARERRRAEKNETYNID